VTTTKDGSKPLKEESQQFQAAKYNVQLGTAYLQQGNYPLAKEKLERALKQNPKDPDVHTSLGLLYDRTGDSKLADKHYSEALRLSPDKPDLVNNYAVYLCKNGRVDEGVDKFMLVAKNKFYRTPACACAAPSVTTKPSRSSLVPSTRGPTTARRRYSSPHCTWSATRSAMRARWWTPI
jgi:type IV pilus biogenesis/stability protein PilW